MTRNIPANGARLHESRSPGDQTVSGTGAVLRNVAIREEPRVLIRPRRGQLGNSVVPASHSSGEAGQAGNGRQDPSGGGQLDSVADYERGFRAGFVAGEAAQKSASEATLESRQRAGFEQGLKEGQKQGLSEGHQAGLQAAERDARAAREESSARLRKIDQMLATLPREMERRLALAEEEMVALCHAVVCRMLGEHLLTRDGVAHYVRQAVAEASGRMGVHGAGRGGTAIHLDPRDLSAMEKDEELAAWMRQLGSSPGGVLWVADDKVGPGGCVLHSAEGSLDARLETQMAGLRQLLLRRDLGGETENDDAVALEAPAAAERAKEGSAKT
jgi:flagellar assembly protein FliH